MYKHPNMENAPQCFTVCAEASGYKKMQQRGQEAQSSEGIPGQNNQAYEEDANLPSRHVARYIPLLTAMRAFCPLRQDGFGEHLD